MKNRQLVNYISIADGIATLMHPHAEVAIHDAKSQKILYIANCFSKRRVGSPSLMESFEFELDQPVFGPYEKMNWDGRRLKSISIAIKDDTNKTVGTMCINLDISMLSEALSVLSAFIDPEKLISKPDEIFRDDWQEKINLFVHSWLQENNRTLNSLSREEKQKLIVLINNRGGFKGKNAASYVAGILGLGRATVYKYLKELKENE